jgi:hypothetical protein
MSHGGLGRWAVTGVTVLACSLLLAPGAAGATWSEPLAVSPTTQFAEEANIAIDAHGDMVVVWRQYVDSYNSAIWVSVKPAGGSFSAPVELSELPGQNQEPEVALGPAGEVLVVWGSEDGTRKVEGERVMFSEGSVAGGAFSQPKAIALNGRYGGGLPLDVVIDGHGEALVVWQGLPNNMLYATRAAGAQGFSVPVELSNPGLSLDRPGLAIASNGSAVVAWTGWVDKRTNGKYWTGAFAAVREAKGAFAPTQTLELAPCMRSDFVHTAINDAGQAVVSWTAEKPECESVISDGVRASYRDPGQAFQSPASFTPQELGVAGGDSVSPSGTVIVSGRGSGALLAFRRMPDGSYGDRETISRERPFEDPPVLATDAAGDLYAAAETRNSVPGPEEGDYVSEGTVIANFAPVGGGFGAESVLQTIYEGYDSIPVLATAGDGQAAMIWTAGNVASRRRAYLSMLQPEGPPSAPSPPPAPEGAPPPSPPLAPIEPTTAEQTSALLAMVVVPPPTIATVHGSVLGAIQRATRPAQQRPSLIVRGRTGRHASAVVVRLFRGTDLLRTARAHIGDGRFRALLSVAGLPRGRYRMQILLRGGRRERSQQRWISLA